MKCWILSGFTVWIGKMAESMRTYFDFKKYMKETVNRVTLVWFLTLRSHNSYSLFKFVIKRHLFYLMSYDQCWVEVRFPLLLLPLLPPSLRYQLTSHQGSSAPLRAALLYVLCPLGTDRYRSKRQTKKKENFIFYGTKQHISTSYTSFVHITQFQLPKKHICLFFICFCVTLLSHFKVLLSQHLTLLQQKLSQDLGSGVLSERCNNANFMEM